MKWDGQVLHAESPKVAFPDWDTVADNSRPVVLYCENSMDGIGATLE